MLAEDDSGSSSGNRLPGLGGRRFLGAAAVLQLGSLVTTGVGFVSSVALARLLGPVDLGAYSWVMSTGTTIGLTRRLGQDYSASTRMAEGHAVSDRRRVRDALVFYVFVSVATSVVVLPLAISLAPWVGVALLGDVTVGVLLQLYLVQGFWAVVPGCTVIALQAARYFPALVRLETVTSLLAYLLPVALAWLGYGVLGVFWGQVLASLAAAAIGWRAYQALRAGDPLVPSPRELAKGVVRPCLALWNEIRFGLSIAADKSLVSLYNLAPITLLGVLAAREEVGQLRVALGYMAIPAVALSPISRLLMVDLPRARVTSPGEVRSFFFRVTVLGCLASVAVALVFALGARMAIPVLYGDGYAPAAALTLALLLDVASVGLGIAAGPVFRTYNRTDLPIRASVAILAVGLPLTIVLTQWWAALGAAVGYGLMVLSSRIVAYVQCLRILRE